MANEEIRRRATEAAKAIVVDLSDRRGLGQEWEQIDKPIRREILATWIELIVEEMAAS